MTPPWRTSSYTYGATNCAEVAAWPGCVAVRDSKHRDGARLTFTPDAWREFTRSLTERKPGNA